MAEYYVVRDKNTGLYFRGKGVNRWGKHYNQASIYRIKGQAECTIKGIAWRGEQAEIVPIQIVENPTDIAEVVRCKDCKHRGDYNCPMYYDEYIVDDYDGYHDSTWIEHDRTADEWLLRQRRKEN